MNSYELIKSQDNNDPDGPMMAIEAFMYACTMVEENFGKGYIRGYIAYNGKSGCFGKASLPNAPVKGLLMQVEVIDSDSKEWFPVVNVVEMVTTDKVLMSMLMFQFIKTAYLVQLKTRHPEISLPNPHFSGMGLMSL
jgi:hypothetical protein